MNKKDFYVCPVCGKSYTDLDALVGCIDLDKKKMTVSAEKQKQDKDALDKAKKELEAAFAAFRAKVYEYNTKAEDYADKYDVAASTASATLSFDLKWGNSKTIKKETSSYGEFESWLSSMLKNGGIF